MRQRISLAEKFTNHDARFIDDLRQAFIRTRVSLPSGAVFDGSAPAAQAGFEKAVAKVVLQRSGMVKK